MNFNFVIYWFFEYYLGGVILYLDFWNMKYVGVVVVKEICCEFGEFNEDKLWGWSLNRKFWFNEFIRCL